jgi:phytoene dehydrogenase-like protein
VTASNIDAVVVGSGPNGLAAAITLAQAGVGVTVLEASVEVGGGARSRELTVPGLLHDTCSAVHPLGAISPFFRSLPLAEHGLAWRRPEVDMAHPLDGGRAAALLRALDDTAAGLGPDGDAWRRTFAPLVARFDELSGSLFGPVVRWPDHPVTMARFGLRAARSAKGLARRFRTDEGKALFAGSAAHFIRPLGRPMTSAAGVVLTAAGHRVGWPVAVGGSQSITDALVSLLGELGGKIETATEVKSMAQLSEAKVVLFDTTPSAAARIVGDRLPNRVRRAFTRFRHGPGSYKLDLAVDGGIPWTAGQCRRAGTVHVGGTVAEIAQAERDVHRGRMPERPFVLLSQQYLADPQRSVGDVHPVWAYAHVPHGFMGDATEAILDQIERFAPGTRERIVGQRVSTPRDFARCNANYPGGDVANGANDLRQVLFRPRVTTDPYSLGVPGLYLCSAATPPGAGVHGMCGHNAALRALRELDDLAL